MTQNGWEMMPHGMIFGPMMMMLMFIIIIVIVALVVRFIFGGSCGMSSKDNNSQQTPQDIIKERFAKGEIDKKEFEEKKKLLSD